MLVRNQLGSVRPTVHQLPEKGFTYGQPNSYAVVTHYGGCGGGGDGVGGGSDVAGAYFVAHSHTRLLGFFLAVCPCGPYFLCTS
jgi:hypothetical protein